MKQRPKNFLSPSKFDKNEVFDYVRELHSYLWRFVHVYLPGASGYLDEYLDQAINKAEDDG